MGLLGSSDTLLIHTLCSDAVSSCIIVKILKLVKLHAYRGFPVGLMENQVQCGQVFGKIEREMVQVSFSSPDVLL